MLYRKVQCPNCGNEIIVKGQEEPQKCKYCKRLLKVNQRHIKGKKWEWTTEPVDFPDNDRFAMSVKGLSGYEDKEEYNLPGYWDEEK